jgi:hypothetical protein
MASRILSGSALTELQQGYGAYSNRQNCDPHHLMRALRVLELPLRGAGDVDRFPEIRRANHANGEEWFWLSHP